MILYADSSSLIKLYLSEEGWAEMRQASFAADEMACSKVGYAETRVALARAHRDRRIDGPEFQSSRRKFDVEWPDLVGIEVSDDVLRRAGDLGDVHAIRGFDAIHLASAVEVRGLHAGSEVLFASADRRLNQAAVAEGFLLAP